MTVFSICTTFVTEGKLEETIASMSASEETFTAGIGVLFRRFFQCVAQPHIIWTLTEWKSEKHHNDAAQSIMKTRRDDRIASIRFGPEPYFEIFCNEEGGLGVGQYSDRLGFIVVAHGIVSAKAAEPFLKLRNERIAEMAERLDWLRIYPNRYNAAEFVALLGFVDEEAFNAARNVGDLLLEEYLFTGLRKPLGMSYLAGYNQFFCTPLSLTRCV
jgi:hypothetical protein